MATHTAYYTEATGGTYYAYPVSQSLTDWSTYRVQLVEGSGDNVGRYSGSLDDANGEEWHVFSGATQPSSWADSLASVRLTTKVSGTLQTLDAVDTALDTRHTQTQDLVTSVVASVGSLTTTVGTPAGASIAADIAAVGTIVTYAKDEVSEKRTWKFTRNSSNTHSPNIVTVHPNFDGTLAFDLTNQLNPGAAVSSVTGVTVTPTGPTISGPNGTANPSKTSDGKKVLFDIDGGQAADTDYTFTCTVSTTDSDDALIVTGTMKSRNS